MNFHDFKLALETQFEKMKPHRLFKVDVSKDDMWETYLGSFPAGTNPIYRERTVHDCQCCKQFIRVMGNVVADIDGQLVSIWDGPNLGILTYDVVATQMSDLMLNASIREPFFHYEPHAGTDSNNGLNADGSVQTYKHFYLDLPGAIIKDKDSIRAMIGKMVSSRTVFTRALEEITAEAVDTVLELIAQKSLYKGDEFKGLVEKFRGLQQKYRRLDDTGQDDLFSWQCTFEQGRALLHINNSAIGTLLNDLSGDKGLDAAVGAFEAMVAPANYKRPTALITKSMINQAQDTVEELGFTTALERRHAVPEDLTINNVLFADRAARGTLGGVFEELSAQVGINPKHLSKVEEVDIETFIKDVLPNIEKLELLMENSHSGNLMSLIAPVHADSNNMLKWENNFSWTYNGELTDSMKQLVKAAGGNVEGVLRFSIRWNDNGDNHNDFDAHCIEPDGYHIYFGGMTNYDTRGNLDVDIIHPNPTQVAVENITWPIERLMLEGLYKFRVHNYSHRGGTSGFSAELEYKGEIHSFEYGKNIRWNETVTVAELVYDKRTGIAFQSQLPSIVASKEIWGLSTMQYQRVSMMMNSPNHWDGNEIGNKHYFFILDSCIQSGKIRGFYNEFLTDKLRDHRKVFEVLGSKTRVEESESQLSGLGFSSTQRNSIHCRVSGSFTRNLKITF